MEYVEPAHPRPNAPSHTCSDFWCEQDPGLFAWLDEDYVSFREAIGRWVPADPYFALSTVFEALVMSMPAGAVFRPVLDDVPSPNIVSYVDPSIVLACTEGSFDVGRWFFMATLGLLSNSHVTASRVEMDGRLTPIPPEDWSRPGARGRLMLWGSLDHSTYFPPPDAKPEEWSMRAAPTVLERGRLLRAIFETDHSRKGEAHKSLRTDVLNSKILCDKNLASWVACAVFDWAWERNGSFRTVEWESVVPYFAEGISAAPKPSSSGGGDWEIRGLGASLRTRQLQSVIPRVRTALMRFPPL